MEEQIIITAAASFFFFLAAIAILFRLTRQEAAIIWMIRVFFCVAAATAVVRFGIWNLADYAWWAMLYGLFTALFVLGIFSTMEASVTLGIFTHIAQAGGGITRGELRKRYNAARIVKTRIARLLYSGELLYTRGAYTIGHTSYFRIREVLLTMFRLAFARP